MKFGVREICDVTFKATADGQKIGTKTFKAGQPAFMIDTAKTSSLEQGTTTVYATGGKGNNNLISWEGEKTMTFTVEDALISPMGLAVLSGAGLIKNGGEAGHTHVHVTLDKALDSSSGAATVTLADLQEETGLQTVETFHVCKTTDIPAYATVLDGSGAGIDWIDADKIELDGTEDTTFEDAIEVSKGKNATFTIEDAKGKTVKLDFYVILSTGITEVEIKPSDFGGFFYIEASTLYRREDTGLDMAAEIIIPKVKVQSGFTFSMASSGDPSTFTFTMDAFPGYTQFDKTKKVMCVMQILGTDDSVGENNATHTDHAKA